MLETPKNYNKWDLENVLIQSMGGLEELSENKIETRKLYHT